MLRLALAALLAAALPAAAQAEERITSYSSDVRIQKDGALDVTETIEVIAEGVSIRHGIYRDFPTTRRVMGQPGSHVGFKVLDVRRDGDAEPFAIEGIKGGVRVRIGSADSDVAPGAHRYVIHYQTTRQIGHFEISTNSTGTRQAMIGASPSLGPKSGSPCPPRHALRARPATPAPPAPPAAWRG